MSPNLLCIALLACAQRDRSIPPDEIMATLIAANQSVEDMQFTVHESSQGYERSVDVTLIGKPHWKAWQYRVHENRNGVNSENRTSFDGHLYRVFQSDGLGGEYHEIANPDEYLAYCGIFLSNIGFGPDHGPASDSWLRVFESPGTRFEECTSDDCAWVVTGGFKRLLEMRYGFMPTLTMIGGGAGLGDRLTMDNYIQVERLWFPTQFERGGSKGYKFDVQDIKVNQGTQTEAFSEPIPFGTSLLVAEDVTRIVGSSGASEAESSLQAWLEFQGACGRAIPQTKPGLHVPSLANEQPFSPAIGIILLTLAIIVWIPFRRTIRPHPLILLLLCPAPVRAQDEDPSLMSQIGSAARCEFLVARLYGNQLSFADVLDSAKASSTDTVRWLCDATRQGGHHAVFREKLSIEELISWPYPVIVRMKPSRDRAEDRYAVYSGATASAVTLFDPNPFGRLAPWPIDRFRERWTGAAILTAPTPLAKPTVNLDNSTLVGAIVLSVSLSMRLAYRFKCIGSATASLMLFMALLPLSGCDARAAPSNRPSQRLDTSTWSIGKTYPQLEKKIVRITNSGSTDFILKDVRPSCGCILVAVPLGKTVPSHGSIEFPLRVDLSNTHGAVGYTVAFEYSDGFAETLTIGAVVSRGLLAQPDKLAIHLDHPGDATEATIVFSSDDGKGFEVLEAGTAHADAVTIQDDRKSVLLRYTNHNSITFIQDDLQVRTNHPKVPLLHVPVLARFKLNWEARPSALFISQPTDEWIDRMIQIASTDGTLFKITSKNGPTLVVSTDQGPAVTHEVKLRLKVPANGAGSRRCICDIETTMPLAEHIEIPVTFYPPPP